MGTTKASGLPGFINFQTRTPLKHDNNDGVHTRILAFIKENKRKDILSFKEKCQEICKAGIMS